MKKRKQGWYKKAKIKFIEREIYSYELTKRGMFGSDRVNERKDGKLVSTYFGGRQADWQEDICKVAGFAERFIWGQNLAREQADKFYFYYETRKNFKY